MTHPQEIALLRYAGGEHSDETGDVVAHLASCADCRAVVQESRQVAGALRALSAPAAPPWRGDMRTVRRQAWHAIAATFVAGILVGGTATYVGEADMSMIGVMPTMRPPAMTTHVVGPGRWTYLERVYTDSVLWANPKLSTVIVDSATVDGVPEWVLVHDDDDTLRIDRRDLSPISRSSAWHKVRFAQQFTRDSVVKLWWTATRSHRVAQAIDDSGHARIADDAMLRLYFRTIALDKHWRGSVRMLDDNAEPPPTANLAVVGRHTIATPIGECDCWQVSMTQARWKPRTMWVRVEDGTVVKTEGYAITELVAADPLPN